MSINSPPPPEAKRVTQFENLSLSGHCSCRSANIGFPIREDLTDIQVYPVFPLVAISAVNWPSPCYKCTPLFCFISLRQQWAEQSFRPQALFTGTNLYCSLVVKEYLTADVDNILFLMLPYHKCTADWSLVLLLLLLFMMMGWDSVSELRPVTGLLFFSQMT
jgi:hypothetical protein